MSLPTLLKVQKLQAALHAKAKGSPSCQVLRAVRQGVSSRCAGRGLRALPEERRRRRHRRAEVRRHRGVRCAEVAGRTGARAQRQELSSAGRAAGLHSEAGRQAATVGDTDDQRSRGADGGGAGLGADLRGRSAAGAIRVSSQPQRTGSGGQSAQSAEHGTYGGGGRRLERLLRQHSARRVDEVGGPSGERQAPAASDQDVAGGTGGRDRRSRQAPSNDPQQGRGTGHPARGTDLAAAEQSLYATVRAGVEDPRARAAGCEHTSSITPTTS